MREAKIGIAGKNVRRLAIRTARHLAHGDDYLRRSALAPITISERDRRLREQNRAQYELRQTTDAVAGHYRLILGPKPEVRDLMYVNRIRRAGFSRPISASRAR